MDSTYQEIIERAEHYGIQDTDFTSRYIYFSTIAESLVKTFSPNCVLDTGCNCGALVKAFVELGIEAYGVDIAQDALSAAPEAIKKYLYRVNVVQDVLPFPSDKFDLVTTLDLVEHLPNYGCFISEMRRVMKMGQFAYISTPSKLEDFILYRRGFFRQSPEERLAHCNLHSKPFWIKLFRAHQLEYVRDFPKEDYKKAISSATPQSNIKKMILRIYSSRIVPDYRSNLIFQKVLPGG